VIGGSKLTSMTSLHFKMAAALWQGLAVDQKIVTLNYDFLAEEWSYVGTTLSALHNVVS